MNFIEPILPQQREAKVRYLDAEFQIIKAGEFVRCGVSGDPIRIDNLRYWNVDKQVAYKSADISFKELLKTVEIQQRP